ncbi:hypothetical protein FRB90_002838 [Tulasnella sp. 427]|nr:hypothetical protein FRB90_002838 [Tulasnella sp. 427]
MPALTMGSWSNIQLPALPWRRQRSTSKSTPRPPTTTYSFDDNSPIIAPIPRRILRLPNLSLPTVLGVPPSLSLDNVLPPTPDSLSSADDDDQQYHDCHNDSFGSSSLPDTSQLERGDHQQHSPIARRNIISIQSASRVRRLSLHSPTSNNTTTSTSSPASPSSNTTIMPYATPAASSPVVGGMLPAPSPLLSSFLDRASINIITTPALSSPSPATLFNYNSNTSLDALPSVPRRKLNNVRPKLVTPQPSPAVDKLFPHPPTTTPVDQRVLSEPESLANVKRVRTTNFTTVVPGSDSNSQSSDEEGQQQPQNQPQQHRGYAMSSPIGEGGINMAAVGRRRGEIMRHAVTMDASSSTPSPSITTSAAQPSSSSYAHSPSSYFLAHSATAGPTMSGPSAATPSPLSLSPYPQHGDSSSAAKPLAARKFHHQAVVAGQGNVLRLNMDAIKRARGGTSGVVAAPGAGGEAGSPSTWSAATPDGRKYATVGPSYVHLVRKKSGELVKPALRTSRTYGPGESESAAMGSTASSSTSTTASSMSSFGGAPGLMYRRNSAPSTPNPKNVHFDKQLEHVKLFLAEQKPAAVSRSGSPDPMGGSTTEEEDWPRRRAAAATAAAVAQEEVGKVVVKVVSGCECVEEARGPYSKDVDVGVKMESLVLGEDGTTLKGSVVVKNLAYDKRVAARFTLDWWQTTSEVVARYAESVSAPPSPSPSTASHATTTTTETTTTTHDRFVFSVKLGDVMSRIEEKRMFLAVRYNSAGVEMWDNNGGGNYEVRFERVKVPVVMKQQQQVVVVRGGSPTKGLGSPTKERREWSPTKNNVDIQMADLRCQLERAVLEGDAGAEGGVKGPVFRKDRDAPTFKHFGTPAPARKVKVSLPASSSNQSSPSMSPVQPTMDLPPSLGAQLSTRYDLSAALNRKGGASEWNPNRALQDTWNPPPLPSSSDIKFNRSRSPRHSPGATIPFPTRGGSTSPERREASHFPLPPFSKRVAMALGSPRDRDDDLFEQGLGRLESDLGSGSLGRGRNHRRGSSYFDGWMESVKMTPPGTPQDAWKGEDDDEVVADLKEEEEVAAALLKPSTSAGSITGLALEGGKEQEKEVLEVLDLDETNEDDGDITPSTSANDLVSVTRPHITRSPPSVTRFNSFPQTMGPVIYAPRPQIPAAIAYQASIALSSEQQQEQLSPVEESIASTPSITSASSPSQSPSSPSESLPDGYDMGDADLEMIRNKAMMDKQDYHFFLNRFCFFTGDLTGAAPMTDNNTNTTAGPRRIRSDSDVDGYFSHHASSLHSDVYHYSPPSGAATPTNNSPSKGMTTPRAGTPVSIYDSNTTTPVL